MNELDRPNIHLDMEKEIEAYIDFFVSTWSYRRPMQ